MQWGNVAEWIAAIGTVGALVFTAAVLRNELQARANADEDRRLRYAGSVTAWIVEHIKWEGEPPEDYIVGQHWTAHVRNAGETPVYQCVLIVGPTRGEYPDRQMRFEVGVVPPDQEREELLARGWIADDEDPYVEVEFTDSTSKRWRRARDGRLREVTQAEEV